MDMRVVQPLCGRLLQLPLELQQRVLEELDGRELCIVESTCHDLRRLVAASPYLYHGVLEKEFGVSVAPAKASAKAHYVQTFVQARLDNLERQRRVYNSLKHRVEELDDLLGQADDVRELLGGPELLSEASMVFALVGDMEQDVLQQRWDASEDLMEAEEKMQEMQGEVETLLSRMPISWFSASKQTIASALAAAAASTGCTIA